jgi:hypothetical protein
MRNPSGYIVIGNHKIRTTRVNHTQNRHPKSERLAGQFTHFGEHFRFGFIAKINLSRTTTSTAK